jgi:hypothetical protein
MDISFLAPWLCSCAMILATVAWIGDYRRQRRADIERVGFMPWIAIFFLAFMVAVLLLAFTVRQWLGGAYAP